MMHEVILGDSREVLKTLEQDSFDSVVTDPPSGIAFGGVAWDSFKSLATFKEYLKSVFSEVSRVLKPGGHMVVWALPRTSHFTGMALEETGFEIRDALNNVKSRSIEIQAFFESLSPEQCELLVRALPTDAYFLHVFSQGWPKSKTFENGLGTNLKPAAEVWWMARKPLSTKTVEAQLQITGTGAINVDGTRIYTDWNEADRPESWKRSGHSAKPSASKIAAPPGIGINLHPLGRWPTNALFTHAPECIATSPESWDCAPHCHIRTLSEQGVSRYFNKFEADPEALFYYSGKVPPKERVPDTNNHLTQKRLKLMRHLVRLVTPIGGRVLDPFAGSGSTLVAAVEEGFSCTGIEKDPNYVKIAKQRLNQALVERQDPNEFYDE